MPQIPHAIRSEWLVEARTVRAVLQRVVVTSRPTWLASTEHVGIEVIEKCGHAVMR
jgi:hypothetical protein